MKLTKIQRKLLKFYLQHRTTPPSVASVLRSFAVPWLMLALLAAASTWFIWAGWPVVAWLIIGTCAGAFLRDIGRIQILFRTWQVTRAALDWQRIQELLSSDDSASASTGSFQGVRLIRDAFERVLASLMAQQIEPVTFRRIYF
jgi:hypothetical protein